MAGHVPNSTVYPGKSPYAMKPVDECVATVLSHAGGALVAKSLPLQAALGHILARNIVAPAPVPPFPASIMDGFAIRAADGKGRFPVDLLSGTTAGTQPQGPLSTGHVRYITTGAAMPEGADAVVKVEDTKELWEDGRLIIDISVTSKPGANIRQIGSDTKQGEIVLRCGTRVGAGEIGILAALGLAQVEVYSRPRVALLSTGDELVDVGAAGSRDECRGQIVDCNRPMLHALVTETGAEPIDFGIVRDEPGHLRESFAKALTNADIVVTSGGVSRGSKDHVKMLLEELGHVHFGEMCMKPGKPTTFATVPASPVADNSNGSQPRSRLVFALPGNPVSCFVTFKLLVVPAIEQMCGWPAGTPMYPRVDAELAQAVEMDPVRPEYHRAVARWEGGRILAESTGFQRSSRIASVATTNCFLEIPKQGGVLPKGTMVKALLLPNTSGGCLNTGLGGYPLSQTTAAPAAGLGGYPLSQTTAGPAAVVPPNVGTSQATVPPSSEHARQWRVGVLTVGEDKHGSNEEVTKFLHTVGVKDSGLLRQSVSTNSLCEAIVAWSGGNDAMGPPTSGSSCNLILVLGNLGIGTDDALVADAVRSVLHRDAPGICDAVLRAGLLRSPLTMIMQLVAGVRNQTVLVIVPMSVAADCVQAVWPLLPHVLR